MKKCFCLPLMICATVLLSRPIEGSPRPSTIFTNPAAIAAFDEFGNAVAASGTRVVVGAAQSDTGATDAGVVYVYDLAGATPHQPVLTLTNPIPAESDRFGTAVGLSGSWLIVGAPAWPGTMRPGTAYFYDVSGATPSVPMLTLTNPAGTDGREFGFSVGIWSHRMVVGAHGNDGHAGAAYVYDLLSATPEAPLVTLTNPGPVSAFAGFGAPVAMYDRRVVVGTLGTVYVFNVASGIPNVPEFTIENPSPQPEEDFGGAVAIDRGRIVVGGERTEVYVYDLSSATPSEPTLMLTYPNPDPLKHFGEAVAISDTRIVVGAHADDEQNGIVYVYDLRSTAPATAIETIENPAGGESGIDRFGLAVAVAGARIVVGAPEDNLTAPRSGVAYEFMVAPTMQMVEESPGVLKLSWTADERFVLQCADRLAADRWRDYGTGPITPVTILTTNQLPFYRLVATETSALIINEVDYDQPGTDTTEFVEIFNGSSAARDLSQLALVFINGATSTEYLRVALNGTLGAGEFLVVASASLTGVPEGVRRINFIAADNNIQNGAPDGIALVNVVTLEVVDALSYEGDIRQASINGFPGRYVLVEGAPLPLNVQDSNSVAGSLGRSPNGQDTHYDATDWTFLSTPTPGTGNP